MVVVVKARMEEDGWMEVRVTSGSDFGRERKCECECERRGNLRRENSSPGRKVLNNVCIRSIEGH